MGRREDLLRLSETIGNRSKLRDEWDVEGDDNIEPQHKDDYTPRPPKNQIKDGYLGGYDGDRILDVSDPFERADSEEFNAPRFRSTEELAKHREEERREAAEHQQQTEWEQHELREKNLDAAVKTAGSVREEEKPLIAEFERQSSQHEAERQEFINWSAQADKIVAQLEAQGRHADANTIRQRFHERAAEISANGQRLMARYNEGVGFLKQRQAVAKLVRADPMFHPQHGGKEWSNRVARAAALRHDIPVEEAFAEMDHGKVLKWSKELKQELTDAHRDRVVSELGEKVPQHTRGRGSQRTYEEAMAAFRESGSMDDLMNARALRSAMKKRGIA